MAVEKRPIRFAFLGDIMLGGEFIPYAETRGLDKQYPFADVLPHLLDVDVIVGNLEGPLFRGTSARQDVTAVLHNDVAVLGFLGRKAKCVLCLANNHIMDYGTEGLEQTTRLLQEHGLHGVGAGATQKDACDPVVFECRGARIAFLAYTTSRPHVRAVTATPGQAGCASIDDFGSVLRQIVAVREQVDIVCVSVHWGKEYHFYPDTEQVSMAHALSEAGATFVIGHHPHVLQGIERYGQSLIAYSLGNFFLPPIRMKSGRLQLRSKASREFMVMKAFAVPSAVVQPSLIGGVVSKAYSMKPYDRIGQEEFCSRIESISKPIGSPDYAGYVDKYRIKRDRQLLWTSLGDAFRKLAAMPVRDVLRNLTLSDIRRNLDRVARILSKS